MSALVKITYSDFETTVRENAGEVLVTSGGRALFHIAPSTDGVEFTPVSTGKPRGVQWKDIDRYLDVFNQTQSTSTSDYQGNFRNASYVLSVIQLFIGQQRAVSATDDGTNGAGTLDPDISVLEGDIKVRSHRYRERSRELVLMAKQVFRKTHGDRLFCEVCDFDFMTTYGEPDFIEAHHCLPLSQVQPGTRTKLSDLAMVCANCHRMQHRGNPWPDVPQLKQTILAAKLK